MFNIPEELKKLPRKPGVYIMKDENEEIIYVGKAINLRNRVRQYFMGDKSKEPKTAAMVPHIKEFEYIVTDSEMEALILECTLIKSNRPRYNIMLRDDKMYPYVKVTLGEEFPRIIKSRKYLRDGGKYYGPITDVSAANGTIDIMHMIWPIRKCTRSLPRDIGRERPCLNYHLGRCLAPCAGLVSKEEYGKIISEAVAFLEGRHGEIIKRMESEMAEASRAMDYERAAALRDKITSVKNIEERQKMSRASFGDSDVIAVYISGEEGLAQVFFVRDGKVSGREHFFLNSAGSLDKKESISGFIKQFYSGTAFIPREIIIEEDIAEREVLEAWLSSAKGTKVSILSPQKGDKYKLARLAAMNAETVFGQFGERMKREEARTAEALGEISKALGLPREPDRIEAYDISNIMGSASVGSMVVFEKGKAKKSDYRKFRIKTVAGANDYASMKEVVTRRMNHAIREGMLSEDRDKKFSKLPELILMDGGKPQINAAKEALSAFGADIPVCGMVKDDRHRTRGLLYNDLEVLLPAGSEGFKLITRIQDEAHRFAIEYHRKLRDLREIKSMLDDIPGIGPRRRKGLLMRFGDIDNIKKASEEELLMAEGMNRKSASAVYKFFRG